MAGLWQNQVSKEIVQAFYKTAPNVPADVNAAFLELAQSNTPDGYKIFYELVHNKACPDHVFGWVCSIYDAYSSGIPTVLFAHRGSTKTTAITQTLASYRIGCLPSGSSLLVQLGDDIATDNAEAISGIIEHNPAWKLIFPHVVPDRNRGWSVAGYEVMRTDIPYESWRRDESARKDPSFIGLGYKSRAIIGKHPSRDMFIDDIHDENNTASERELVGVLRRVQANLEPTLKPHNPMHVVVGTPWIENDLLATYEATGEFNVIKSPLYVEDEDGVFDEELNARIKLLWPEMFPLKEVQKMRRVGEKMDGGIEFARMFLLDLEKASNRIFTYMSYPSTEINWNWPTVGGVDPAGTSDVNINKTGRNDAFAMAWVSKLPGGGAVVIGGVQDRCTQAEAERHILTAQSQIPNYLGAVVEGDGQGEQFYQVLYRNPGIILMAMKKTGGRGKGARLERELQPWLAIGRVRISDAETPFLNALRHELNTYPNNKHDDCMDAVYWALRGMPDVLQMPAEDDELPAVRRREKQKNPLIALGSS